MPFPLDADPIPLNLWRQDRANISQAFDNLAHSVYPSILKLGIHMSSQNGQDSLHAVGPAVGRETFRERARMQGPSEVHMGCASYSEY